MVIGSLFEGWRQPHSSKVSPYLIWTDAERHIFGAFGYSVSNIARLDAMRFDNSKPAGRILRREAATRRFRPLHGDMASSLTSQHERRGPLGPPPTAIDLRQGQLNTDCCGTWTPVLALRPPFIIDSRLYPSC